MMHLVITTKVVIAMVVMITTTITTMVMDMKLIIVTSWLRLLKSLRSTTLATTLSLSKPQKVIQLMAHTN